MRKFYGLPNNKVRSDMGDNRIRDEIFAEFPDADEVDRVPGKYEKYIHGEGYILNSVRREADEAEQARREGIATAQSSGGLSGVTVKQAKDVIQSEYDGVRAISDPVEKLNSLIDVCEWVDKKEAAYLLK